MRLRACILAIAVVTPLRAFAQTPPPEAAPPAAPPPAVIVAPADAPPPPPPPAAAPMAPAAATTAPAAGPKFTFGGLADAYWLYYFNPADGSNSMAQPTARAFDTNGNSITLALTKLSMNASLDPVAFQVDMGYGATGSIINSNNGVSLPAGQVPGSFVLLQAFGTVTAMTQGPMALTFDFGKFYTTAGAEVIEANKNWLYSRSILFNVIPLVHTGARANLKVSDQLSLQLSLVNGWNNDPDNNAWKTVGLNAAITINPMISIIPTVYIGKEATQPAGASTPGNVRILADLVVPITISDKVGLNLNVDYINAPNFLPAGVAPPNPDSSDDYIIGVSAMGRFVLSDHAYLAARGEFVRTHVSVAGVGANNNMEEVTAMVGLPAGKNFELRPEVRADFSGDQIFAGGTKKNQVTGTVAALTFF